MECFISKEGTRYFWIRNDECIVDLTKHEVSLLKIKVKELSDRQILNTDSGNGVTMGIPVYLSNERKRDIKSKLIDVLKKGPFIGFQEHAIVRIVEDAVLDDDDPKKRGWTGQDEVKNCIMSVKRVSGFRLNIDHAYSEGTDKVKYLHTNIALELYGQKKDGIGRVVLVLIDENTISVVTVL